MGRWKKYKSVAEFTDAVESYFSGITYTEKARKPDIWVSGKYVQGDEIIGDNGKPIEVKRYAVPPSITDLQCHLGISRQTWSMYAQREGYRDIIELARMRVEAYLTQQLVLMGRDCKGIIFSLENNFGYADREKTRNEAESGRGHEADTMTALEKMELLKSIAKASGAFDAARTESDTADDAATLNTDRDPSE